MDDAKTLSRKDWKLAGLNLLAWVAAGIIAGTVVGILVVKYQAIISTADTRTYWSNPEPLVWELTTENLSDVSAQNLVEDLRFTGTDVSHMQTAGAYTSEGIAVESKTFFSGRDQVTLKADTLAPHAVDKIRFVFRAPLSRPREYDIRTSAGVVHAR